MSPLLDVRADISFTFKDVKPHPSRGCSFAISQTGVLPSPIRVRQAGGAVGPNRVPNSVNNTRHHRSRALDASASEMSEEPPSSS